jgi:FtsZ-binding cell division protein ZapB
MAQATDSGIIQAGVTLLLGVLGAAGTIYAARGQIRKQATDSGNAANQQLIDNALKLHEVYRAENEALRLEVDAIKKQQDQQEQAQRDLRQAFNAVSRENETLKRENDFLKRRVAALEARLDTGDLTPPPHNIP